MKSWLHCKKELKKRQETGRTGMDKGKQTPGQAEKGAN